MPRLLLHWLAIALLAACCLGARADALSDAQRLQASGDITGALAVVDAALRQRPRDAQLRFLQGVLLSDLKRDGEAADVFQRLSEEFPELPDPFNNLAVIQAAQGRLEIARASLETALRNDPSHRAARENLADVYVRLALRLWEGLAQSGPADTALSRKLRLARELVRGPG